VSPGGHHGHRGVSRRGLGTENLSTHAGGPKQGRGGVLGLLVARGQRGMSCGLLVSRRSWWRAEMGWRGVVARERACAPWRALAHGTAARTRLRRVLWTLTRVAASVGSGGEVLGILQTRWSGAGWRLACCPRRGGNGGAALSTIDVLARAGGHGWGTEVLGR
jgi:hypothetical protein